MTKKYHVQLMRVFHDGNSLSIISVFQIFSVGTDDSIVKSKKDTRLILSIKTCVDSCQYYGAARTLVIKTYWSKPEAGPPGTISEMTISGFPDKKCGLSRPPEIASPNPTSLFWKMGVLIADPLSKKVKT